MFRKMRRISQQLPEEQCRAILERGSHGVMALLGDGGYPYAVPLSYFYDGSRLLFHGATAGHRLDAIAGCDKASFCVVGMDDIVPEAFTSYFRSVIVFGRARLLTDDGERRSALAAIAKKYTPDDDEGCAAEVEKQLPHAGLVELVIESMTGKQAIELLDASRGK